MDKFIKAARLTEIIVAIPIRDEEATIGLLLEALARAARRSPLPVTALVFANNCIDHSAARARAFSDPFLAIELHEVSLTDASAGRARGLAMELAMRDGALLMTTDGDAEPDADWIAAALRATLSGADLVCGTIGCDCSHVLATPSGRRITSVEIAYADLQHELRHAIDIMAGRQGTSRPHYIESGASMAIRADRLRMIGGLPDVGSSEDRALVHRAEEAGLTIRYDGAMRAHVSARLHGRARGGMAETLQARMVDPDPLADQAMLPVDTLARLWRTAVSGLALPFPSRAVAFGRQLRASDLERDLPNLERLLSGAARPAFAQWREGTAA
ncbi:glycosyltransferase family 2 protein [Falsirhodobacter xinxiangensis]|uniref:glycosyltransferase family 2 protein n=1 Tax=Falsirhodobacter xinxiangensis TaxID=2530049 RepID=UPI0010AA1B66|nr:glycosyltransferase family 2 protein [Rhodobacter xinxiangensis]